MSCKKGVRIEEKDDDKDIRADKLYWGTGNSKLRKTGRAPGAASFSLPAGLPKHGGSCLGASTACLLFCYALTSHFDTPKVLRPRQFNLAEVWKSIDNFVELACWDLQHSRLLSRYQAFRLHDSGDFLSRLYFLAWTRIARRNAKRNIYAYTKSLSAIVWEEIPPNMIVVQSYDEESTAHLIRWDRQVAKVFRTKEDLLRNTEGYVDATESDNPVLAGAMRLGLVYHPESRLETTFDPACSHARPRRARKLPVQGNPSA